jgi:hypothetical protein
MPGCAANLATGDATDAQFKAVMKSADQPPGGWAGRQAGRGRGAEYVGFLSARLRAWLLLAIALPLARLLVHRVAVAAERHDPSARRAKLLHRADSAVTAVSGRSSRRARR